MYPLSADLWELGKSNMTQQDHFDGKTFVLERDGERLTKQLESVKRVMSDGVWRSLSDIAALVEAPEASCSSRLRDLRKTKFGGFTVNRRYISKGLFHYQVLPTGAQGGAS